MATSTEDCVVTQEDIEAAEILIKLSQDTWYQPIEEEDATPLSAQKSSPCKKVKTEEKEHNKKSTKGKKIKLVADDTNETLMILQEWNKTKPDPLEKIFKDNADVAELFSEPIKKQLTMSDVEFGQGRLMLGKLQVQKKMLHLLKDSEIPKGGEGLDVLVFGPNKVVQNMKFKMWSEDTPVLTSGWRQFVATCDLKEHCDFLTIWMFRHRDTGKICFAIDRSRFLTITGPLSSRISNSVF